jgi:hypothetical protein
MAATAAGAARRRSQETTGAVLETLAQEVTVKAEVVVAAVSLEEHELHLRTNSW